MDRITELLADDTLVTRRQIAELLHVSLGTVNNWGRYGKLPAPINPGERPLKYVTADVIRKEVNLEYSSHRHIDDNGNPVQMHSTESTGVPDGCYGSVAMAIFRHTTVNNLHRRVREGREHLPHITPTGAFYWTKQQVETPPPSPKVSPGAPRWEDVVPDAVGPDVYSRRQLIDEAGCSQRTWARLIRDGTIPPPHRFGRYQYWCEDGMAAARRFRELTTTRSGDNDDA